VIAAPGRPAAVADVPADVMIGVTPGRTGRQMTIVEIPPGALFCLFTDGLVVRPDQPAEDGVARLCAALVPQPAETAALAVMAAMIGGEPARDDVAMLILRRQP
jgi:serine phosphatase RsbU (regulator of sigma subunit)